MEAHPQLSSTIMNHLTRASLTVHVVDGLTSVTIFLPDNVVILQGETRIDHTANK